MTLLWRPFRWRKRRRESIRLVAFFKQSFDLKIKGDLIPESAAEEIIGELQALFARHNAGAALSAKAVFKPTKEFHTARHRINFELGMLNSEFNQLSDFQFQHVLSVAPVGWLKMTSPFPAFVDFAPFVVNLPAGTSWEWRVAIHRTSQSRALPGKTRKLGWPVSAPVNRKPFALPRKTVECSASISLNMTTGKNWHLCPSSPSVEKERLAPHLVA